MKTERKKEEGPIEDVYFELPAQSDSNQFMRERIFRPGELRNGGIWRVSIGSQQASFGFDEIQSQPSCGSKPKMRR